MFRLKRETVVQIKQNLVAFVPPVACFKVSVLLPPSGQCGNRCESTDCQLARVEELQQATDRQVARHLLLCLLLTLTLLVVSKLSEKCITSRCQPVDSSVNKDKVK